jgi:hypothetical protein
MAVLTAWFCLGSCSDEQEAPEGLDDLAIESWNPDRLLAGTRVTFQGTGFVAPQVGNMTLTLEGRCGSYALKYDGALQYEDDEHAFWLVPAELVVEMLPYQAPFVGTLEVTRKVLGYSSSQAVTRDVTLQALRNLAPALSGLEPDAAFLGDELAVSGNDMLTLEEGQTLLYLTGQYEVQSPPMVKHLEKVAIPVSVAARNSGTVMLAPDKLGIHPGVFTGSAHLANFVASELAAPMESAPLQGLTLNVQASRIEGFSPSVVRRGQRVQVTGRGFVPNDSVGETATLVALEGVFNTASGKQVSFMGDDALLLFPEQFTGNSLMEIVLRVTPDVDGQLAGLGLVPGVFEGRAHPHLFWGSESSIGQGFDFTLSVAPQLQVVFVKFLPSFDEAFGEFGMSAVGPLVRQKVLERCNRDYSAFNVTFVDSRPVDYVEYSIIELSGHDPNGANLLGLDNTTGKDNNNLRFNDVVGGKNAETQERGYYAYGGVFLHSFLMFSPTIAQGTSPLASPRFDQIFSSFVPQLGGTPISDSEYPGGSRETLIAEAVRVLGNLVGGTVAHEIGHSLGLAQVPGHPDEYHDLGDNPAWLMDAGNYRPFDERSEIDGKGPEVFAPYDFDYLQQILPKG